MSKMVEMQVFQAAKQMQNFIYLVGDAKQCVVIDACWDVEGIIEFVKDEKMKLVGRWRRIITSITSGDAAESLECT